MQHATRIITATLVITGAAWAGGCSTGPASRHNCAAPKPAAETVAVAVIQPTAGQQCQGTVTFTQVDAVVRVVADITGLTPGQRHGIHVHQFGDIRLSNGTGAGGHYNPQGHDHALPNTPRRHAGDLGSLTADDQGAAHYEIVVDNISVDGRHNPVRGRAVIIHAQPDDGGQPTGNAGARIGQGVIGVAKP